MKYAYIGIGIIVGWLTVGIILASSNQAFWSSWQQARIITLLESIEKNTR